MMVLPLVNETKHLMFCQLTSNRSWLSVISAGLLDKTLTQLDRNYCPESQRMTVVHAVEAQTTKPAYLERRRQYCDRPRKILLQPFQETCKSEGHIRGLGAE